MILIKLGKIITEKHDELRINKDKKFIPLINLLPGWLTPNDVTIIRTVILIIWFPFAIFKPSIIQVVVFLMIYFMDLLDGAIARIKQQTTYFGGYLYHISDKFSNIAMLIVFYGLTDYRFSFLLFFIWWDVIMSVVLAVDCYYKNKTISYIRSLFEFVIKSILWIFLILKVLPTLI